MAKVITCTNQKGGIGKTTTATAIALRLKDLGYKTLLIDLDPQCNSGDYYSAETDGVATLYDVLISNISIKESIQHQELGDIIPCDILLDRADTKLTSFGAEHTFEEALAEIKDDYDYIILDCPPANNILSINALVASDGVIIPVVPERFALTGLEKLTGTITQIQKYANPKLKVYGLLRCMYRPEFLVSQEFEKDIENVCQKLNLKVFKAAISRSTALALTQGHKKSYYSTDCKAAQDYISFVDELLEEVERG